MDVLSGPVAPVSMLGIDPVELAQRAHAPTAQALDAVATGFESLFTSLLIKQMRQGLEPETMFGQDNSDILGGLFDMSMGQHLAQAGALGIGKMLRTQLAQRYHT